MTGHPHPHQHQMYQPQFTGQPPTLQNNPPHYVTLSRAAMLESGDARLFEQQSLQFKPTRYSSQPQLNRNSILDFGPQFTGHPPQFLVNGERPEIKPKPKIRTPIVTSKSNFQPKYQQPVSQQVSLENSEYLFPDLPPPPDALLDNTTTSASPPSFQQNSRYSSLPNKRAGTLIYF